MDHEDQGEHTQEEIIDRHHGPDPENVEAQEASMFDEPKWDGDY